MVKLMLLLASMFLLIVCNDKKKDSVATAIKLKESKKGHELDSYTILRTVDSVGLYTVYYEARVGQGSHITELKDSLIFYVTGDGILEAKP